MRTGPFAKATFSCGFRERCRAKLRVLHLHLGSPAVHAEVNPCGTKELLVLLATTRIQNPPAPEEYKAAAENAYEGGASLVRNELQVFEQESS